MSDCQKVEKGCNYGSVAQLGPLCDGTIPYLDC